MSNVTYNEESHLPEKLHEILDDFSFGINIEAGKEGYNVNVFGYIPDCGAEWFDDVHIGKNASLKLFIEGIEKIASEYDVNEEAELLMEGADEDEYSIDDAEADAEIMRDTLVSFSTALKNAFPDITKDVLINNTLSVSKDFNYHGWIESYAKEMQAYGNKHQNEIER